MSPCATAFRPRPCTPTRPRRWGRPRPDAASPRISSQPTRGAGQERPRGLGDTGHGQPLGVAAPPDRAEHDHADDVGDQCDQCRPHASAASSTGIGHHIENQWADIVFVACGEAGLHRRGLAASTAGRARPCDDDPRVEPERREHERQPVGPQWVRACSSRGNAGAAHRSCRCCRPSAITCPEVSRSPGLTLTLPVLMWA